MLYYIKQIAPKGKLSNVKVASGNVIKHIKKMGYIKFSLPKKHISELEYKFNLGKSKYLKFKVLVKKTLNYRLSIFTGINSRVLKQGTLDDIYTKTEPSIYLSPSGIYAVCVVKANTPYNQSDFLFFFRIY